MFARFKNDYNLMTQTVGHWLAAHSAARLLQVFALLILSLAGNSVFAAYVSLCPAEVELAGFDFQSSLFSQNGTRTKLYVTDVPVTDQRCEAIGIEAENAEVLWASPVPETQFAVEHTFINLLGDFSESSASISEVIGRESQTRPEPVTSLGVNLLPMFTQLVFGLEARASWESGHQLNCAAGQSVAGVRLNANTSWPDNISLQLQIKGLSEGSFEVAISDATRINNESPLILGNIESGPVNASFELPPNNEAWSAVTLVCPQGEAELQLQSVSVQPVSDQHPSGRAAWIWAPNQWLNNAEALWSLQVLEQVNELYLTIPVDSAGNVLNQQELEDFVRNSKERGFAVWPVIGDPRDVLEENMPALLNRTHAYASYNSNVQEGARLAGLQLDIEPYLLPGFNLGVDHWRERYLETVLTVHDALDGQLELDLVVPFWFGTHPSWGPKLFDRLARSNLSLTIMNYRTSEERLREGALPFLQWGLLNGNDIRIGLESGSLGDQVQRSYNASMGVGELWQYSIGTTPILVLFDRVVEESGGISYKQTEERRVSSNNVTFAADLPRLNTMLESLESEWRNWPSFAGIAIHGLDEIYLSNNSDD